MLSNELIANDTAGYTDEELLLALWQVSEHFTRAVLLIHAMNIRAGWWEHLESGNPKDRNVGELLALVHSEISEALEGDRKNLPDDKLPQYPMAMVELIDAFIRIADILGAQAFHYQKDYEDELDPGRMLFQKLRFNHQREDHKRESRRDDHGKRY